MNIISVVSGGFDPIHSGHINLLNEASKLGKVIVLLNSDEWLIRKKGKRFLPYAERKIILENLKMINDIIPFNDDDGTCINGLNKIKDIFPDNKIIFCNGGDRTSTNIPEMSVDGIEFAFGVGGTDKKNSSSSILREATSQYNEQRVWGSFFNLYQTTGCKVKELIIKPNCGISYQRHRKRSEVWFIRKGTATVKFSVESPENFQLVDLNYEDVFIVTKNMWHQLYNNGTEDCIIIEIQYGEETTEKDIERIEYYNNS